jgi:hypothetical protein
MRYLSRGCAVVVGLMLLAGSADAQRPQTRSGFWIGLGLGWGSYGIACDGCGSEREGAMTAFIKLGGTVSPKLLLGVESAVWNKEVDGDQLTAGNVSFTAYYYPKPAGGLFLQGGFGASYVELTGFDMESGVGLVLGVGYDIRIGATTSVTPVANFNWGQPADGFKQNFFQLGVGFSLH